MRSDLFWAVIDHVRTWLGEDGPFRHTIEKQGGRLDGVILRRIALAYNVSRGIKKGASAADEHAQALADLINDVGVWPSDFGARARVCLEVAKAAKARGHTHTLQASAVTKLSWFAHPAQWTVYDRFVSAAMNLRNQPTEERVLAFYTELEKRGFVEFAEKVQLNLDEVSLMPLFGARVLDKFMMLSGARMTEKRWTLNFISTAESFLEVLPADWRVSIEQMAERVENAVDLREFLKLSA